MTITGSSASATATIDTSLDTLAREVLLVWEVDIAHGGFPTNAVDSLCLNAANLESLSIHDNVQTGTAATQLNDPEYIAGQNVVYAGGFHPNPTLAIQENKNPDSTDFPSRDRMPLAIITDSEIVCRSGFSSSIAFATSDTYQARFRIMAQRAKADADTYAALVTGLI